MRIISAYVSDTTADWIEAQATETERSRSWVIERLLRYCARRNITVLTIPRGDESGEEHA